MQLTKGQKVNYVAPPAKEGGNTTAKPATVIEIVHDGEDNKIARLALDDAGKNTALASWSDEKEENTFHVAAAKSAAAEGGK